MMGSSETMPRELSNSEGSSTLDDIPYESNTASSIAPKFRETVTTQQFVAPTHQMFAVPYYNQIMIPHLDSYNMGLQPQQMNVGPQYLPAMAEPQHHRQPFSVIQQYPALPHLANLNPSSNSISLHKYMTSSRVLSFNEF